jgi:hypothetical protein
MKWSSDAVGVRERVPLLIADARTWSTWQGADEPQDTFDMLEGVVGPTNSSGRTVVPFAYEGGVFEIGVADDTLIVMQHYESDDGEKFNELRAALEMRTPKEFMAGEIEVNDGLIVGDCWANGTAFDFSAIPGDAKKVDDLTYFVPLPAGKYLVLEGVAEDVEAAWYRFVKGKAADYARREE